MTEKELNNLQELLFHKDSLEIGLSIAENIDDSIFNELVLGYNWRDNNDVDLPKNNNYKFYICKQIVDYSTIFLLLYCPFRGGTYLFNEKLTVQSNLPCDAIIKNWIVNSLKSLKELNNDYGQKHT